MAAPPRLILVGRVAGAFGVRGEVRIVAYTDDPAALLAYRALQRADGSPALTLTAGRAVKGALIARAAEIETRDEAEGLRGLALHIARDLLPAPDEDEFYFTDLIGLAAVSPQGEALGRIKSVQNFGAGDLLEIEPATGAPSWWAPFTKAAVPQVRIADGVIVVAQPEVAED
jgi:16S rRNA processing protein RimM